LFWEEGQITNRPIYKIKINIYEVKIRNYSTQDRQPLLKAKYCPRAMSLQHLVNAGQLVQAVSNKKKTLSPGIDPEPH